MTITDELAVLDGEDYARILRHVLTQAGPGGIVKDEARRRAELIAERVAEWKVSAAMYEMFRTGRVRLELTDDESDVKLITQPGRESDAEPEPLRRNSVTKKHLRAVADVYQRAAVDGLPPTMAVARHFAASHSTAARWVSMARRPECGFLPPATRGQRGTGGGQ